MSASERVLPVATFLAALAASILVAGISGAADGGVQERPEDRASVCVPEGKIRFALPDGGYEVRKSSYCTNSGHWVLISQSCIRDTAKCRKAIRRHAVDSAREALPGSGQVEFGGEYGTPGFKMCREMGGNPRFLEFLDAGEWHPTDACFFGATGLYISAERLYAWFKTGS